MAILLALAMHDAQSPRMATEMAGAVGEGPARSDGGPMTKLPKIVQIATCNETSAMHYMLFALDEHGDIWQLVLDRMDRKWIKTTREVEQEAE